MTMFSRVLGFARDAIVARVFGAGMATDAFFVAFKLPNLLRRIFAEGAFSQAFVPILAEYKSQQGEEATRTFIAYVSGLLTLVLAVVTVLGMLAAPGLFTLLRRALPIRPTSLPDVGAAAHHLPYFVDLTGFAGGGDPQYLEPLLDPGFCANAA